MRLDAASGYEALQATNLAKGAIYAGTIKARNWDTSFLPYIANTRTLDELTTCGDVMIFDKPPATGAWREYEKNQDLVRDQVSAETFCLSICGAAYKSLKFDREDIRKACDYWPEFETAFLADAWRNLEELWQRYTLTGMSLQLSATNLGNKAGRYKNINLGSIGNPYHLEPTNIINYLASLREVLRSTGRWYDGDMVLIVPPEFSTLVLQTSYDKQWCCDPTESVLFNGLKASNIAGFKVIETDYVTPTIDNATGRLVFPIIAAWNDAYAFTGEIVEAEINKIPNTFGVSYDMLTVFGGGIIYPEAIAKGYVTFSTSGIVTP